MKLDGGSIIDTAMFQILRTRHIINREALAILYRDVTLVSIEWNQSERTYLNLFRMPQDRPFYHFRLSSPTSMWHYKYNTAFCTEDGRRRKSKTVVLSRMREFLRKIPLSLIRQKSLIHVVRPMIVANVRDLKNKFRSKMSLIFMTLSDVLLDRFSPSVSAVARLRKCWYKRSGTIMSSATSNN